MERIRIFFISVAAIFILGPISFAFYFNYWLNQPFYQNDKSIDYYAARGSSFKKVISNLSDEKVLSHPKLIYLYSTLFYNSRSIKYGTYRFTNTDTPKTILKKLFTGDTVLIKITLPEGLNIYEVSHRLEKYFPTIPYSQWLNYLSSATFTQVLDLEEKPKNLEGFLFPQTYFFDPHPEPQVILKTILNEFNKYVTKDMFEKAKKMGLSPIQFITLASIIEKETSLNSERNLVSAVYWNRIKIKMKLQADPTVIYGVLATSTDSNDFTQNFESLKARSLTKKNLLTPTPYNTYTLPGLPIGPIASPGMESILATLNPAKTNALYFVATGRGGHTFSNTLKDQNKAVKQYLQYKRQQKNKDKL